MGLDIRKVNESQYNSIIKKLNQEVEDKELLKSLTKILEVYRTFIGFMQKESIEELKNIIEKAIKEKDGTYIKRFLHSIHFPGSRDYNYINNDHVNNNKER